MSRILILLVLLIAGCASSSQMKGKDDGSAFVCKVLQKNSLISSCVRTAEIPNSKQFMEVPLSKILPGTVIWWSDYMGILDLKNKLVLCSKGRIAIGPMVQMHGKPRFFLPDGQRKD